MPVIYIYGGGIAGLTAAHELIERGFQVEVYEKSNAVGGMAKSKRQVNSNVPTEHSWRGYGQFYNNLFDIMKRIPIKESCKNKSITNGIKVYSLQEVEKNNTREKLWTYYKDKVYDITKWVDLHPGGEIILKAGGRDLEKVWKENQLEWHANNSAILERLSQYEIGILESSEIEFTTYNNLSDSTLDFTLLKDTYKTEKNGVKWYDYPYLIYIYMKSIIGDKHRNEFEKLYLSQIKNYVSQQTYDYLVYFLSGPGYGFDINTISMGHHSGFVEKNLSSSNIGWKVSMKPTSEALFQPWVEYLQSKGVIFHFNSDLQKIELNDDKTSIKSTIVSKNGVLYRVKGDEHCFCINPYNMISILKESGMDKLYNQHLNLKVINNQIGFCIGFKNKIKLPKSKMAFVIIDSPYNITFYPQDDHWCENVDLGKNVKSLWSGTCIMPYKNGSLTNKPAISLTRKELIEEIIYQMFGSKKLEKLVSDSNNGKTLTKDDIVFSEIYDEWKFINGELQSDYKKWVNTAYNEKWRPEQKTEYNNMWIGGAHTQTSINIWSMEGAAESGKIVSELIYTKYKTKGVKLWNHKSNKLITILKMIDKVLSKIYLPNLVDVIGIVIIIVSIYFSLNFIKEN